MTVNMEKASQIVIGLSERACLMLNQFLRNMFITRGGRIGSGMGGIIEAAWGFFMNRALRDSSIREYELGWMYAHDYNDFACVKSEEEWDPDTKKGELFRIEVKSMVTSADESKAHFDRLRSELSDSDLLAVFIWNWVAIDPNVKSTSHKVCPQVIDQFVGRAKSVAILRDALHLARGGFFVSGGSCPDRCKNNPCNHTGEPLNAERKRERITGPKRCRVSSKVSYAANFGGLVRMLKCRSEGARTVFRKECQNDIESWRYVSFIHKNFRDEETNCWTPGEWRTIAKQCGQDTSGSAKDIANRLRSEGQDYRSELRKLA